MQLLSQEFIDPTLSLLSGSQFTTQDFIDLFARNHPDLYNEIVAEYGIGGKGSGSHYSAKVHLAKSLSHHTGDYAVSFLRYIDAPIEWGNQVIALWECNGSGESLNWNDEQIEKDIQAVLENQEIPETQRKQLILSRIGQGQFRKGLIDYWKKCAATGCNEIGILTASHMKPWAVSSNGERLDPYNGLLLTPNLDRLFDRGLITFDSAGGIQFSPLIKPETLVLLGVGSGINITLEDKHAKYISYHRDNVFKSHL